MSSHSTPTPIPANTPSEFGPDVSHHEVDAGAELLSGNTDSPEAFLITKELFHRVINKLLAEEDDKARDRLEAEMTIAKEKVSKLLGEDRTEDEDLELCTAIMYLQQLQISFLSRSRHNPPPWEGSGGGTPPLEHGTAAVVPPVEMVGPLSSDTWKRILDCCTRATAIKRLKDLGGEKGMSHHAGWSVPRSVLKPNELKAASAAVKKAQNPRR